MGIHIRNTRIEEMKLSALVFAAAVDARRYSFKELMGMFKDGDTPIPNWGSGSTGANGERAFQQYTLCPVLDVPEGAEEVRCDGESCAVECKGGYMIKGNPQTKCKKDPKNPGQFVWRRPLGSCYSCDTEPSFNDWKVWQNCSVNKKNQRTCKFGCLLDANAIEKKKHALGPKKVTKQQSLTKNA